MNETNGGKRILIGAMIALLAPMLIHLGCFLWWAGSIDTRVEHLERDVARIVGIVEQHSAFSLQHSPNPSPLTPNP